MAMPTDFWRNEQSLNIFRTKPCQRLSRDGVCGWRSQCQYSHFLDFPRRQYKRYNYSPELCPKVYVVQGPNGMDVVQNDCKEKNNCKYAHSKEEVLFHPQIFKTSLCEEHATNGGGKNSRSAKKNKCHRYYCPFAHGPEELRQSNLSQEARELCLRKMEIFPSDMCCHICTPSYLRTNPLQASQDNINQTLPPSLGGYDVNPMLWGKAPMTIGPHAFDVLSTVPNQVPLKQPKDTLGSKNVSAGKLPPPIEKPRDDMFSSLFAPEYKELNKMLSIDDYRRVEESRSLFSGDNLFAPERDSNYHLQEKHLADLNGPAYVPLPDSLYTRGWGSDGLKDDWSPSLGMTVPAGPNLHAFAPTGSRDERRIQAEAYQQFMALKNDEEEKKAAQADRMYAML